MKTKKIRLVSKKEERKKRDGMTVTPHWREIRDFQGKYDLKFVNLLNLIDDKSHDHEYTT